MDSHKEREIKNKGRLGILEDDEPSEEAKAAFHHKAYDKPSVTVIEYIRALRRKNHGDI